LKFINKDNLATQENITTFMQSSVMCLRNPHTQLQATTWSE